MLGSTNSKCSIYMHMNSKPRVWIYMRFTVLTLTTSLVYWKSSECIMQTHRNVDCKLQAALHFPSPAVPPRSPFLLWISVDTPARICDGLLYNEDLDPCSRTLRLPVTGADAEWNCVKAYWCFVFHRHQSTSSANKCAFEWSYSCLTNENGNCWSQRNFMGDKADRPPQLIWKTARILSQSAF